MILAPLAEMDRFARLHPLFPAAIDYLRSADLAGLPPGKHAIQGDRLFVIIAEDLGRGRERSPLEAHRRYIDLQYIVRGADEMGWRRLATCTHPQAPFDLDRDIIFFDDPPETWFTVPPGALAVFFPEDAHAPLAGQFPGDAGALRKAVVKVAVDG
jgi:biofilm protein TabA